MGFWSAFVRKPRAIYLYDNEGMPGEPNDGWFSTEQPSAEERSRRVKPMHQEKECTIQGCRKAALPGMSYCGRHNSSRKKAGCK